MGRKIQDFNVTRIYVLFYYVIYSPLLSSVLLSYEWKYLETKYYETLKTLLSSSRREKDNKLCHYVICYFLLANIRYSPLNSLQRNLYKLKRKLTLTRIINHVFRCVILPRIRNSPDLSTSRNSLTSQTFIAVPSKYRDNYYAIYRPSPFHSPFHLSFESPCFHSVEKKRESCIIRTRLSFICSLEITVKRIFSNADKKRR